MSCRHYLVVRADSGVDRVSGVERTEEVLREVEDAEEGSNLLARCL